MSMRPTCLRRAVAGLLILGSVVVAPRAIAAGVSIVVNDAKGQPATDAVVLLEPLTGRTTPRPMAQVDVSQSQKTFNPRVSVITTGTPVNFPNFDTVRHHVYSRSRPKTFELKLYAGVPEKPLVFDKPGIVVLGCNIHDTMEAWIIVSDTPWYALVGANGKADIANVPAGRYTLRIWHPSIPGNVEGPEFKLSVGTTDLQQTVQLTTGTAQ